MWTRLHRAPSWRVAVATTPLLSMRRGSGRRVFSVKSADLNNTASLNAEQATQSLADAAEPETDQDRARRSLYKISSAIRTARTPAIVTTLWNILSRHEPVFVEGGFVRAISSTEAENGQEMITAPSDQVLLRMVSPQELLQLERQGQRHVVVERALPFSSEDHSVLPLTHDDNDTCIVLLSENFVARKIVPALHRLGQFEALTTFVETMASDRRLQLQLLEADTKAGVTELTSLGAHSDALYIASLGQLKQHAKILEYCKPHASDLGRFIVRRDAFASLLDACVKTRDGELAKIAIDQAMDKYPLLTFNTRLFTAALHANLRAKPKTLERLETAMHIYRRMFHDAGYILAPQEWSLLFNSCIYLDQRELAIEIFRDYRAHGIAPFQHRFEQALRTACRFHQYDLAIEMARLWIHTEAASPPVLTTLSSERLQQDEAECLNKILWEMLKNQPTLDQVEQVLLMMQPRDVQAGALVVRRIVSRFFESSEPNQDEDAGSQIVTRFLTLWERCPQVIQRMGFVIHLMLDACSARGWHDQCERVIQYAIAEKMNLPIGSTTKIMEQYAARGEFDSAIQLGELVVQASTTSSSSSSSMDRHQQNQHHDRQKSRQWLPDNFFECLLTSYLFRQRFADAVRVGDAFRLGERRGESNLKLAAILRDARSMADGE